MAHLKSHERCLKVKNSCICLSIQLKGILGLKSTMYSGVLSYILSFFLLVIIIPDYFVYYMERLIDDRKEKGTPNKMSWNVINKMVIEKFLNESQIKPNIWKSNIHLIKSKNLS